MNRYLAGRRRPLGSEISRYLAFQRFCDGCKHDADDDRSRWVAEQLGRHPRVVILLPVHRSTYAAASSVGSPAIGTCDPVGHDKLHSPRASVARCCQPGGRNSTSRAMPKIVCSRARRCATGPRHNRSMKRQVLELAIGPRLPHVRLAGLREDWSGWRPHQSSDAHTFSAKTKLNHRCGKRPCGVE